MQTYRDLIQASLQDLQVVGAGDTLSADDAQLGLDRLNDWIDALALEGLTIPAHTRMTWPLVPGQTNYTVGPGAMITLPKPVSPQAILDVGYYDATTPTPTEILFGGVLTSQALLARPQKYQQAPEPIGFFYVAESGPVGRLYPLPIPTRSTLIGVIYAPTTLTDVLLTDVVALPAGYRRFLRSNLTLELAAAFEQPVPPAIARIASESMARVKTTNLRMSDLGFALGVPGLTTPGYDITTDT